MADRVVLHIGTMKSGTTYLQDVLSSGALEPAGGYYLGGSFGSQNRAVRSFLHSRSGERAGDWESLVATLRERSGVAVVSHEFLSFLRRQRVADALASFGGLPVEVVVTVRDQHRALPAQWQSFVRNRGADDWETYLRRIGAAADGDRTKSKAVRSFRRAQDVPGILGRWSGHAGVPVTMVVVPPSGSPPDLLWRRFCEAARLTAPVPPAAASRSNESLGYASTDALRRVNAALGAHEETSGSGLPDARYRRLRKDLLEALLPLRTSETRPELDRAGVDLACRLNAEVVRAVEELSVGLVGPAEELPREPAAAPDAVAAAPEPQVRHALEACWAVVGGGQVGGALDDLAAGVAGRLAADQTAGDNH